MAEEVVASAPAAQAMVMTLKRYCPDLPVKNVAFVKEEN